MSIKTPNAPENASPENPFATKTFGRKGATKLVTAPPAAAAAPVLKQRKGERRMQKSDRRMTNAIDSGYTGMERRTSGRNDRRTVARERRQAVAKTTDIEKSFIDSISVRRKTSELWYTNPQALELASPRIQAYHDHIQETMVKTLDVLRLSNLPKEQVAEQIKMHVREIAKLGNFAVTPAELDHLCRIAVDDMLGLGPLEPLLARADVDEIMVNGPKCVYVEINGVIERSSVAFRNERQLLSICQRIVARVGRHVDEASPFCDARLPDGSRVNIILPPLALDGIILTIRKFPFEKITLEKMVELGSLDAKTAELIRIIAACRTNVLISGGTGSGKTTMLNCLTRYINRRERIITCEDAAELQLQQPHVLRLETRIANIEGGGQVTMRDLVKNSLRMRPDRLIVGEVRGPEAFDLLSAMSTGHDGSMGTIHANTPRDALARLENMIAMAGLNLPTLSVRQQICSAVNVIIHVQRTRDGSRKVVSISEVTGMEGDVISMQDLITFHATGKESNGKTAGVFRASKLHPHFFDKLCEHELEDKYIKLMESIPVDG